MHFVDLLVNGIKDNGQYGTNTNSAKCKTRSRWTPAPNFRKYNRIGCEAKIENAIYDGDVKCPKDTIACSMSVKLSKGYWNKVHDSTYQSGSVNNMMIGRSRLVLVNSQKSPSPSL